MEQYLNYQWMIINYKPGRTTPVWGRGGINKYTPILWFDKGKTKRPKWFDVFQTMPFSNRLESRYANMHKWSKSPESIFNPLCHFSKKDYIIFDPFTGGGTVPSCCIMLDINFLAFEIDIEIATQARKRAKKTQKPLPKININQLSMELCSINI
jgi:DNA modification methylase